MICPCQTSLRQTLPSWGPTFFSGSQTWPFPIWTPLLVQLELSCPDHIWCCFHDLRFLRDTFPEHTGQGCSSLFPTGIPHPTAWHISFKDCFCNIIWSFIVFHALFLCSPISLWTLEGQGLFFSCSPLCALCLYIIGSEWKSHNVDNSVLWLYLRLCPRSFCCFHSPYLLGTWWQVMTAICAFI